MISFDQVQAKTVELLSESANLSGVTIVADLGTDANEAAIEDALAATGVALSVTVPIAGKRADLKAGRAILEVEILVFIAVNQERNDPSKNPDAIGVGIYDLVKHAAAAVLTPANPASRPVTENDRFGLAENALTLDLLDAGVFRYQLSFTKRCVL